MTIRGFPYTFVTTTNLTLPNLPTTWIPCSLRPCVRACVRHTQTLRQRTRRVAPRPRPLPCASLRPPHPSPSPFASFRCLRSVRCRSILRSMAHRSVGRNFHDRLRSNFLILSSAKGASFSSCRRMNTNSHGGEEGCVARTFFHRRVGAQTTVAPRHAVRWHWLPQFR